MNCQKARYCLSAYCDGSLSASVSEELEAHIRNCKSCDREKLYLQEIIAAARSLPQKHVAEDFNLQLMNRIFAEQNHVTESYLPLRQPSIFRRPIAILSSLATVGVAAVLTFAFLRTDRTGDVVPAPDIAANEATTTAAEPEAPNAQFASITHREGPPSAWDYILGVSGEQSHYRATTVHNMQSLHLSNARLEQMYREHLKRLENLNNMQMRQQQMVAYPGYQGYQPYYRQLNPYARTATETQRLRDLHSSWR